MNKKSKKKALIIGGLSIAAFALFSRKKFAAAQQVLGNLQVEIHNISNINFQLPNVFFDAVIKLTNPTNIDFGATTASKITVKQIRAYTNQGVLVGTANTNVYSLDLPANSSTLLPTANVQVRGLDLLESTFQNLLGSNQASNLISQFNFEIDIQVFGKTITLKA
jgi:hypothetical protein